MDFGCKWLSWGKWKEQIVLQVDMELFNSSNRCRVSNYCLTLNDFFFNPFVHIILIPMLCLLHTVVHDAVLVTYSGTWCCACYIQWYTMLCLLHTVVHDAHRKIHWFIQRIFIDNTDLICFYRIHITEYLIGSRYHSRDMWLNLILYLFNEECRQPMATSGFP